MYQTKESLYTHTDNKKIDLKIKLIRQKENPYMSKFNRKDILPHLHSYTSKLNSKVFERYKAKRNRITKRNDNGHQKILRYKQLQMYYKTCGTKEIIQKEIRRSKCLKRMAPNIQNEASNLRSPKEKKQQRSDFSQNQLVSGRVEI